MIETKDIGTIYIADTMGIFQWNEEKQEMVQAAALKTTPTSIQINHKEWLIKLGDKIYSIKNRQVEQEGDTYTCLDKNSNIITVFVSTPLSRIVVGVRMKGEQYIKQMMYFTGIKQIL